MNQRDPLHLAERLAAGELPDGALEWLQEGMGRFLRGEAPLTVALRLTGAARVAARNRALLRADAILSGQSEATPWQRAARLLDALAHFRDRRRQWRRTGREPAELSALDAALLDAFRSRARPLTSRRRLYELLRADKLAANCQRVPC